MLTIYHTRIPQSRLSCIVIAISTLFNYTHSIGMLFGQGFVKDKATFRGVYRGMGIIVQRLCNDTKTLLGQRSAHHSSNIASGAVVSYNSGSFKYPER